MKNAAWLPSLLRQRLTPAMAQTGLLFAITMANNGLDYAFHFYLGRALLPASFAVVQTVNAALLVAITSFAVMQPVVARQVAGGRQVAGARAGGDAGSPQAIFRTYFRQSGLLGLGLALAVWLGRAPLGRWLNVPPEAVAVVAAMMLFLLLRPVVEGMLQGQRRVAAFGLSRTVFSAGRLALAILLVGGLGWGALGGLATLPLGAALALLAGLLLLGRAPWRNGQAAEAGLVRAGWRLSLAAFLAYAAYTSLQSLDLVWVNGHFGPDLAASYAAALLLRRVLAVLPLAAIFVMYPRAVAQVAGRQLPDRLLARTALAVSLPTLLLAAVYALAGSPLAGLAFGRDYAPAGALLGWMGLAMVGYGLAAMWLNLFLATRPGPFVLLAVAIALLQPLLQLALGRSLLRVTLIFAGMGWSLALGGTLLYFAWLRPAWLRQWRQAPQPPATKPAAL